jgi:protein involved in polysaccharide export with SLBB domain
MNMYREAIRLFHGLVFSKSSRKLGVAILSLLVVIAAHAQQTDPRNVGKAEDLVSQNLSRVAASAAEIKAVLAKESGLLVELKRWVARDAAEHGQIVSDSDLGNDAIFERLETDIQFRSVATTLIQRYGYLLPKFNPESELGKERELLIQERSKWLAENQQEELAQARQRALRGSQTTISCDSRIAGNCANPQGQPSHSQTPNQESAPGLPPPRLAPLEPGLPNAPGTGPNSDMRAQLRQTDQDASDVFSPLPIGAARSSTAALSTMNVSASEMMPQATSSLGVGQRAGALLSDTMSAMSPPINSLQMRGPDMTSPTGTLADGASRDGRTTDSEASFSNSTGLPSRSEITRYQSLIAPQSPELIRKVSPYADIPSLYDMYVQAVARPSVPTRFGADVFENGTRDSQLIPMDLPVGPDYVVGPGDGLSIDLWGGVSQRLYRTVDREGRVSLPELGPVLVSGKSLADVQQNLQQILRTQFRDISADVSLARLRTIRVYEVGDVANPGAYDISSLSTPLNALFAAGGPTPKGSMRILKHYRGNQLVQVVDVYDLLLRGVKTDIKRLENGDTILVPPIGPQMTVEGMVRRPAIYELKDEKNLASVLELAGGLLPTAALRHIEVQRLVAHEKQTMLNLDIQEADDTSGVTKKLESFQVQDGDRIRIFPIAPYNQDAVYLDGHLIRPGRYSYRAGMRVTDVISSYKDLLPEPATQYAEIIRLNAPDFRPSVESFNLDEAFANPSQAPSLRPMDTVRIFSRFDFEEPPTVSVLGDVRTPGTYRTSGQIRLTDAIHLSGGPTPDAQTADAQIFRYLPDGKVKIFSVSLGQALQGDPIENIILQPRDRVLIHRNADAVQPATVYLQGEVARPGRYPLTTNMHVADLIRVGGGLKSSADTQSADLVNYQWSDQAKLTGEHQAIAISAALTGDSNNNAPLHNGDVLTIRQLPGWNDLGASINVKGEVKHPGSYGIRPGERLSSILERAGGFQPDAYPYAAVLQRAQVREIETKANDEIIVRVKEAQSNLELLPDTDARQKQAKLLAIQQWQSTLDQLSADPPLGRVTIRVSSKMDRWKNGAADIEVRAGDTLVIPKRPSFVMVSGQVFNPTAVSFRQGKSAKWYLSQSGGPTQVANKKAIFVIRADGTVIGAKSSLWSGDWLGATLQPGDTVVVPEKALGGGLQWQSVLLSAQVASSIASTAFIALRY